MFVYQIQQDSCIQITSKPDLHSSGILTLEHGTDTLSRNVGKQLPYDDD
jgi:hypothetical protein